MLRCGCAGQRLGRSKQVKPFAKAVGSLSKLTITKDRYGNFARDRVAGCLWVPAVESGLSSKDCSWTAPSKPELRNWAPRDGKPAEDAPTRRAACAITGKYPLELGATDAARLMARCEKYAGLFQTETPEEHTRLARNHVTPW